MRIDDCYLVGKLVKTHGLKGHIVLKFDVDFPEDYEEMESILVLRNKELVPFFVSELRLQSDKAIIRLEDVATVAEAKQLTGCEIYLPLTNLKDLPGSGYYFHELIGCKVYQKNELIGEIRQLYQPSSQYLAEIVAGSREILVPVTDAIFRSVDIQSGKIEVTLPEGLLEIYD